MGQIGQPAEKASQAENGRERPNSESRVHSETSPEARDGEGRREDEDHDEKQKSSHEHDHKHSEPNQPPAYKRPAVIIPIAAVLLLAMVAGFIYWLHARHFESTDDAYIDGHVAQMSPQVAAQVLALHIQDNQFVHRGDLLVELDPTNYQVAVDQAKAQVSSASGKLDQSRAQIGSARAAVAQAAAEEDAARVTLENATREMDRLQAVDERARSRQQLDNAIAAQKTAQAQVEQSNAKKLAAQANVATTEASVTAAEGDLRIAQSAVRRAEVNLAYCRICSPCDGRVTQRTVEVGNYVQVGQAMFMLVETDLWVTANFKETQLKLMRPGQPVTVKIDAIPGREFAAHVDSFQAGSGSRFSVLPAENATGNFVKVVQRVPVKIVFNRPPADSAWGLAPGLSVIPRVRVR